MKKNYKNFRNRKCVSILRTQRVRPACTPGIGYSRWKACLRRLGYFSFFLTMNRPIVFVTIDHSNCSIVGVYATMELARIDQRTMQQAYPDRLIRIYDMILNKDHSRLITPVK